MSKSCVSISSVQKRISTEDYVSEKTKTHLEPCHIYIIEIFDESFLQFCKNSYQPLAVKIFLQKNSTRGSQRRYYVKKYVLKNFANFIRKHLCWSLFLIDFIKKRLQHRFFSCAYCEIFGNSYFENYL